MNDIRSAPPSSASAVPPPDTSRATLSQAWYSALYGDRAPASVQTRATSESRTNSRPTARTTAPAAFAHPAASTPTRAAGAGGTSRSRFGDVVAVIRSGNAMRRRTAAPAATAWRVGIARRSSLALELGDGRRVDVLVQRRGRRVHLVALAHAVDTTTAAVLDRALERTRRQLTLHGLHCIADIHRGES